MPDPRSVRSYNDAPVPVSQYTASKLSYLGIWKIQANFHDLTESVWSS